ncbi:hypothetical protein [Salinimicrobium oceani]|uniref:Uncharacterized protein n=1 Tax=Salinimicrobium oceani TaxID=2722702 RepID=A0ABX1D2J5_9FLAO|nr:hypothetical protein [Salinimicrobium oceani]NJW53552.1 hypothetical protein [Salinimicrobium oceani]
MPGLIIDKVGGGSNIALQNIYKEGDYNFLKALKDEGKLLPGQKYLLKGYQTKYLIAGSDTSSIIEESHVDELLYNYYHHFASGISYPDLTSGDKFTITWLPETYTGNRKVGDSFVIQTAYEGGYFTVPGLPLVMGMKVSYQASFYKNEYVHEKTIRERFYRDLTGTITATADSDVIAGEGTIFMQELQPGDRISYFVDAGYRWDRVIQSIESDTSLTITQVVAPEDIATGVTFEKLTFGKVIMQPGGLLNTDVYDGTPYSGMTAAENQAPPVEDLILTALTENEFSREAESATFIGDQVEYLIDETQIFDRSSRLVATRPGLVIYRENKKLKIRADKDWRAQRYRRFRMNDDHWSRIDYRNKDLYKLASEAKDGGSAHTYYVGGISGLSKKEHKRFMFRDIQNGFSLMDFTLKGEQPNPFTSGYEASNYGYYPSDDPNKRDYYQYNLLAGQTHGSYFQYDLLLNFNEIEVKDYTIIPLDENHNPKPVVTRFKVDHLENTIFLDHGKGQGESNKIDIDCNHITNSVFFTGGRISAKTGTINKVTSLEDFDIENAGEIDDLLNFASLNILNHGKLKSVQFGGAYSYPVNFVAQVSMSFSANSIVVNSVFGFGHAIAWTQVVDTFCKDVLFRYFSFGNNILKLNGCFFTVANTEDHDFLGNGYYQKSATTGCKLDFHPGWYRRTGLQYWLQGAIRDREIKTKNSDKTLYYETISSTGVKAIISIGPDGTETEQTITQGNIRIKDLVLEAANWKQNVDTGKWEYLIENELISASSEVKFIPTTGSLDAVFAAEISPFTPAVAGGILISANIQPTAEILVDLLISPVQDV